MNKIKQMLKDKSGGFQLVSIAVAIFLFSAIMVYVEYEHMDEVSLGVRDAVQSAVTAACTENYDRVYNGVREGYSGGYKLSGGNWSEDMDTGDIYAKLDTVLGTHSEGGEHIKYAGTRMAYSLSDLSVQMTNTPFAPDDPENENKFTCVTYVTLRVPLMFGWGSIPPMEARLKITSGYMAKF